MLKLFTATLKDGALVLPEGADLAGLADGSEVQVVVDVTPAPPSIPGPPGGPPEPGRVRQVRTPFLTPGGRATPEPPLAAATSKKGDAPGPAAGDQVPSVRHASREEAEAFDRRFGPSRLIRRPSGSVEGRDAA